MVEVKLYNGRTWFIDKKLKNNLDILISDVLYSNMDLVIVIDGEEGSGKSFGGRAIGAYIQTQILASGFNNKGFGVSNIHFTRDDYRAGSSKGERFRINIMDESRRNVDRMGRSKDINEFIDYMTECRYKRQFHIFIIPRYHDLHPYIGQNRLRGLITFKKNYNRDEKTLSGFRLKLGEFKLYCDRDGLDYNHRFKTYKYPNNWDAWNWFSSKEVFDEKDLLLYDAKKKFYAERTKEQREEGIEFSDFLKDLNVRWGDDLYTHLQEWLQEEEVKA